MKPRPQTAWVILPTDRGLDYFERLYSNILVTLTPAKKGKSK